MNFKRLILFLCAGSMAVWADDAVVRGPLTGYVFDVQARAIRPMVGFPGAAYMGAPVVSGLDTASVSPDGSRALAVRGGRMSLYQSLGRTTLGAPVDGAIPADFFAWGPANSVAVYSSATRQVQLFNLLAAAPAAAPIDLSSLAGRITAMAFDGQHIVLAVASPAAGGIYAMTAQSGPQLVASAMNPPGVVLAGSDLYFADNQAQQIWQVHNYATHPAPAVFAADINVSSPAALQLSSDGARLYVANAGSRTLGIYDVAARSRLQSVSLNFTPTALDRFGDASVFLLNTGSRENAPVYVLSDRLDRPAVYFVPGPAVKGRPRPYNHQPQ